MKKNMSWKFTDESSVTFQSSVSGPGEVSLNIKNWCKKRKEKLMMVVNIKLNIFPLCALGLTTFLLLPFYVQANFHRQIELSPSLSYP